jgi:hypothetical protein
MVSNVFDRFSGILTITLTRERDRERRERERERERESVAILVQNLLAQHGPPRAG